MLRRRDGQGAADHPGRRARGGRRNRAAGGGQHPGAVSVFRRRIRALRIAARGGGSPTRFALQVFGSKGVIELESGYMPPAHILRDSSWSPGRTGKAWEKISSAGIGKPEPIEKTDYEAGHIAAITDLMAAIEGDGRRCARTKTRGASRK